MDCLLGNILLPVNFWIWVEVFWISYAFLMRGLLLLSTVKLIISLRGSTTDCFSEELKVFGVSKKRQKRASFFLILFFFWIFNNFLILLTSIIVLLGYISWLWPPCSLGRFYCAWIAHNNLFIIDLRVTLAIVINEARVINVIFLNCFIVTAAAKNSACRVHLFSLITWRYLRLLLVILEDHFYQFVLIEEVELLRGQQGLLKMFLCLYLYVHFACNIFNSNINRNRDKY